MPLCTPILFGPLTVWCPTIRVEGALPGAVVIVRSLGPNPRIVIKELAGGGSDRLALGAGVKLEAGDRLVAQQRLGAEESDWTQDDLALHVGPAPNDHAPLAPVTIRSRVWQCGRKLWVQGAMPGAQVRIRDAASVIATGQADEGGNARLLLTGNLPSPGQNVNASQEAPAGFAPMAGSPKQTASVVMTLPVPSEARLPVPSLAGPAPIGCDSAVPIGGVFDGADVMVTRRSNGESETLVFDLDRLSFILAAPLATTGEHLLVTQAMPRCRQFQPSEPLKIEVAGQGKPPTPVAHPPCPDSTDVFVENLLPGASVFVKAGGEEFRAMVPPSATTFICRVRPMPQFSSVEIRQERCGLSSDPTTVSVKGKSGASAPNAIDLADPLFQCARAVRVLDADAPCWIQVWMDDPLGPVPISPQVYTIKDSLQVPVSPHLIPDRDIWVSQRPCDGTWARSRRRHRAGPFRDLPVVSIVVPVIEGATVVTVEAVPGASVSIFALNWDTWETSFIGSGVVDPKYNRVPLDRPATLREGLFAQQSLCAMTSPPGALSIVLPMIKVFTLAATLKRNSHLNNPKPVVCTTAKVTCRHDGGYMITASVENQETKADCIYLRVDFTADWPGPPAFGANVEGALSAAGDGEVTEKGLRVQGFPPQAIFSHGGFFDAFRSPEYWAEFLGSTGRFALDMARFNDYHPPPEAPDSDDD